MHSLTYYTPHVSGLTLYVKRLAEEQAKKGHSVVVLTSRHEQKLPSHEVVNRIKIVRVPVFLRFNKGLIMPTYWFWALLLILKSDIVHLHLPALENVDVALLGRLLRRRVVCTYHCDLTLPPVPLRRIFELFIDVHNFIACFLGHCVVTYTQDFAQHSRLLRFFLRKTQTMYPPVTLPLSDKIQGPSFEHFEQMQLSGTTLPTLGMAARWAQDKGIEYLLNAIPDLKKEFPDLKIAFAGETKVRGESNYRQSLQPLLDKYRQYLIFLGPLTQEQMFAFYRSIDLLVVSSINSTESFGMVQVEAMFCGTVVVATNLPGVRIPIQVTGMGEIAKVADSKDLAQKIIAVLKNKEAYQKPKELIQETFSLEKTIQFYDDLYQS